MAEEGPGIDFLLSFSPGSYGLVPPVAPQQWEMLPIFVFVPPGWDPMPGIIDRHYDYLLENDTAEETPISNAQWKEIFMRILGVLFLDVTQT